MPLFITVRVREPRKTVEDLRRFLTFVELLREPLHVGAVSPKGDGSFLVYFQAPEKVIAALPDYHVLTSECSLATEEDMYGGVFVPLVRNTSYRDNLLDVLRALLRPCFAERHAVNLEKHVHTFSRALNKAIHQTIQHLQHYKSRYMKSKAANTDVYGDLVHVFTRWQITHFEWKVRSKPTSSTFAEAEEALREAGRVALVKLWANLSFATKHASAIPPHQSTASARQLEEPGTEYDATSNPWAWKGMDHMVSIW